MTVSAAEWTEERAAEADDSTRSATHRVRALPGGLAALGVAALLWVLEGTIGLVSGGVLLLTWATLPPTYAFAVGQVAFVAVTRPESLLDIGLLPLAVIELGLVGVLVGPDLRSATGRRTAVWTIIGGSLLGGATLTSYALSDRSWIAAALLVALGIFGGYGIHRYELVALGKVTESEDGIDSEEQQPAPDRNAGGDNGNDDFVEEPSRSEPDSDTHHAESDETS